ncbi:MAG: hypothetical protein H0T73_16525 [Ardenticatenales bacterium]|nr:hypothetical protein [Ardenticatenales bacterium]
MNSAYALRSMLQQVSGLSTVRFDANECSPSVWKAVLGGATLGFLWGVAARFWMRLISTRPEFSLSGTAIILLVATLFGAWTGLAFVARRRGWQGWRHYVPRALAVLFFIPFGFGGGAPLMLTVLLVTLAQTQPTGAGVWWILAALLLILGPTILGMESIVPGMIGLLVLSVTVALIRWKRVTWNWRGKPWGSSGDIWLKRIARAMLLLLVLALFGFVSGAIITDKPGLRALVYILFYLALLYPLFLALRIALEPRTKSVN